jgi:hypothetical protein
MVGLSRMPKIEKGSVAQKRGQSIRVDAREILGVVLRQKGSAAVGYTV